jgi:hypothetical protein
LNLKVALRRDFTPGAGAFKAFSRLEAKFGKETALL